MEACNGSATRPPTAAWGDVKREKPRRVLPRGRVGITDLSGRNLGLQWNRADLALEVGRSWTAEGHQRDTGTVAAQGDSTQPPLSKGGVPWDGGPSFSHMSPTIELPARASQAWGNGAKEAPLSTFLLCCISAYSTPQQLQAPQDQSLTPVRCIRLSSLVVAHLLPSLHLCDPTPKTPAKISYPSWSDFIPPTLRTLLRPVTTFSLFFPFCSQFASRFTIRTRSDLDLHPPFAVHNSTNHHLSSPTRLSSFPSHHILSAGAPTHHHRFASFALHSASQTLNPPDTRQSKSRP